MSKKAQSNHLRGPTGFESHYSALFAERWGPLREALLGEGKHIAWPTPSYWKTFSPPSDPFLTRGTWDQSQTMRAYFLDYASAFSPLSLNVRPGESVWDMCAAPGGKSLILAHALGGEGRLLLTDRSGTRVKRLKNVIKEFLSGEEQRPIEIKLADSKSLGMRQQAQFDKVLLDAPCSSERHLLRDEKELKDWSLGRTKRLSKEQGTLMCSALMALKTGGLMAYSTCSISPLENDRLVEWFLNKRAGKVRLVDMEIPIGEKSEYGHLILPDHGGHGPLFISLLQKTAD